MKMPTFQTEKFKSFIKRSYIFFILLLLLYCLYIGVNFQLEGYSPWKIEIVGIRTVTVNQIKSEVILNNNQNLSADAGLKKSNLNKTIAWITTTVMSENIAINNEAATMSTTTGNTMLTSTSSTITTFSSTTTSILTSTITLESTTSAVIMYANSEIKIIENASYPRTYLEIYQKNLGTTNGTKDFQDKLFEYLKVKAKLTSGSSIDLLSEYIHQIDPKKIAPEHQLSMFPEDVLVPFRISYPDKVWKGKQLPLMTGNINGRTGNIMGEYASLYALHRIYNVSVLMHSDMKNSLSKDFPHLSIKEDLSDPDWQNSSLWNVLSNEGGTYSYGDFELAAAGLFGPKLFNLGGYAYEVQLFHFFYEDIKKEFKFASEIQNEANEYLHFVRNLYGSSNETITYIGFHIRRTDYANHVQMIFSGTLPGDIYFKLAMNYYRKKFHHPRFIVASDDTNFVQESYIGKQKDAHISKDKSGLVDLAILSSCNHSIITMGTYGFWGAYLAGGEVVYPLDTSQKHPYRLNDRLYHQMRLPNFTPIKF